MENSASHWLALFSSNESGFELERQHFIIDNSIKHE